MLLNAIYLGRNQSRNAHLYSLWLCTNHVTWFRGFHTWLCCKRCQQREVDVCLHHMYLMQTNININININCHKPQPQPQQWGTTVTREEGRLATCEGSMWGKGLETHMCLEPQVHFFCTSFLYAKKLKNIGYLHEPTTTRQQQPTLATNASR